MPPRRGRKRRKPRGRPRCTPTSRGSAAAGSVWRGRQEMVKALVVARGFVIFVVFFP